MEYPRSEYLKQFKAILDEMLDLTTRKNNDYGGHTDAFKNFQEFGEMGILVRMSDKWARIKSALWEKRELQVSDETIDDTIMDLAVYSIILLIWRKVHKQVVKGDKVQKFAKIAHKAMLEGLNARPNSKQR